MRPIKKGNSPRTHDFADYKDAKPELVSRVGSYCSYCERYIATQLAIEHIEPKNGLYGQPHLERKWTNFLLACTNCNSCKGSKKVILSELLFPDRDNTFNAYHYEYDGTVKCAAHLSLQQQQMARNTLKLIGLDKPSENTRDSNNQFVALDRVRQRMEAISTAEHALQKFYKNSANEELNQIIVYLALSTGFFSIWMKVFDAYSDMKLKFIHAFKGTEESGCFNLTTGNGISPAPNIDSLLSGGKV